MNNSIAIAIWKEVGGGKFTGRVVYSVGEEPHPRAQWIGEMWRTREGYAFNLTEQPAGEIVFELIRKADNYLLLIAAKEGNDE